ncbi:Microbial collagenase [Catenulispora acidiphila DSM 44928]|uniref:microbial collagenase n=1 Tax=Catenulispora acidiphila (strain DSM 44928 / JCM 14897 / NBRC 102108 / NRRL B-24433 / ID139908) TaxID=479433 RepID=C7PYZ6_CATAD|nr:collagenase [Catenulispora acidiphila]ACU69552.1 Microbial collagenase [Catenulispora acidiphila DSM 44928]
MRHRTRLPGIAAAVLAAVAVAGMTGVGAASAAPRPAAASVAPTVSHANTNTNTNKNATPKGSADPAIAGKSVVAKTGKPVGDLAPRAPIGGSADGTKTGVAQTGATQTSAAKQSPAAKTPAKTPAAQSCTPADFASRSGSTLSAFVKASTTDCINTLFSVTGSNASAIFSEAKMETIAGSYKTAAASYPGTDATSVQQLVLFLRAGYYVQYNSNGSIPAYGQALATLVEGGLDAFFAGSHALDVNDNNGPVLGETIILTDSADEQARYLSTYQRILNAYTSSYNAYSTMLNAVNDVYTPLFRGHQFPAFVTAVTANPSIIDTLNSFALNHKNLLGGDNSYLDSNAGLEMSRFVQHTALQAKVRPLMKGLLAASSMTGPTAPLWVAVAGNADYYDQANCAYYNVCDLAAKLTAAVLTTTTHCDASHTVLSQALTASDTSAVCASILGQYSYFHTVVHDSGPIPGQYDQNFVLTVFASPTDYQTYAGPIYGVDTDNGGITLTGDPTDPSNIVRSIMYQWDTDNGFVARVWNLNHEFTHALDAEYDTKGDFTAEIVVPDIWWIEGVAEYVSYSYRDVTDTEAVSEAATHRYALSTLWQSSYDNSDETRTYPWGYLAVRYMMERHPADIATLLAKFRVGDYQGAYAFYGTTIGTAYDADFNSWLDQCAAGACQAGGGTTPPPQNCSDPDTRAMDQNCSRTGESAAAGAIDYFYIDIPAGTSSLTITTTGGSGTAYLLYNPSTWATPTAYTQGSLNNGTTQSLTITDPPSGYRYISLYGQTAFSGVTITTSY